MAKIRAVTMRDVANAVGLSKAAVSLALRHHPSIPKVTQERIAKAVKKLGYRPNPLVSALMSYHLRVKDSGPKLTIAYVTSHPKEDPWPSYLDYVQMFEGTKKRAAELGCRIEEFSLTTEGMTPARLQVVLRSRGIRGVLVAPLPADHTTFSLDISELALVGLGLSVVNPAIMRVAYDLYQLSWRAVRHCAELGYRRIGFAISAEMSSRLENRLLAGYRQGLFDLGLAEVRPLVTTHGESVASALPAWCELERPEIVIFGTFDDACQRNLPTKIGCITISVGKEKSAQSGMYQNLQRMGAIAVDQLLGQLYHNAFGPLENPQSYLLTGTWNAGKTAPGPGRKRPAFVPECTPLTEC